MDHAEVGRYWAANAEAWTRLARQGCDLYRDHVNTPAFFAMLPEVSGLRGLDIEIRMLPEYTDEQEAADWVINRLVESGVEHVDRCFLEYHQETLPPYDGMRGAVIQSDEYPNRDSLFDDLLRRIREGRIR